MAANPFFGESGKREGVALLFQTILLLLPLGDLAQQQEAVGEGRSPLLSRKISQGNGKWCCNSGTKQPLFQGWGRKPQVCSWLHLQVDPTLCRRPWRGLPVRETEEQWLPHSFNLARCWNQRRNK